MLGWHCNPKTFSKQKLQFSIEIGEKIGHFWPNLAIFGPTFLLRDFFLESRETCLANLSLVSRETVRDSATLDLNELLHLSKADFDQNRKLITPKIEKKKKKADFEL